MLATIIVTLLLQATQPVGGVKDFAEWRSKQPSQATIFELYSAYREHLKQKGLTETEIAAAFLDLEKDRWNRFYANPAPGFNAAPNTFLTEIAKTLKPGRALDIGMGQGRNSIHLATLGWDVTGFDISDTGMALARKSADAAGVRITTISSTIEAFDFGTGQWDLIVGTYEGAEWRQKAVRGLKPGGIIVIEGFRRTAVTPPGASFNSNELAKMFLDLNMRILRYEDVFGKPDFGPREGHVIRLAAQKPE
jgi:2-polyprenyl-3-methyl-5-hydroxy-6-metoxy-1,4-benzoquinol methylase